MLKMFVLFLVVYLVFPEPVYAGPDKVQYFSEPNVQVISRINNNYTINVKFIKSQYSLSSLSCNNFQLANYY